MKRSLQLALILVTMLMHVQMGYTMDSASSPVFSQKAGMIETGTHSFYARTNDEFTSFSTLLIGYRYGLSDYFHIGVEAGVGIQTYLGSLITHIKLFESKNHRFFIGLRTRTGFKYQQTELSFKVQDESNPGGPNDIIIDEDRLGISLAPDLTFAIRLGDDKRVALYYTLYPMFDFELRGGPTEIMFAPVHLGFEVRFKRNPSWSFALDMGFFFPLNDIPLENYVNMPKFNQIAFPNLANMGLYYRF